MATCHHHHRWQFMMIHQEVTKRRGRQTYKGDMGSLVLQLLAKGLAYLRAGKPGVPPHKKRGRVYALPPRQTTKRLRQILRERQIKILRIAAPDIIGSKNIRRNHIRFGSVFCKRPQKKVVADGLRRYESKPIPRPKSGNCGRLGEIFRKSRRIWRAEESKKSAKAPKKPDF